MTGAQWAQLAAGVGSGVLGAVVANRNSRRQEETEQERNQLTEEQHRRQAALQESALDPFRHLRDQGRGLTAMDMLRTFGQGRSVTPPANVQPYMGQVRRGYTPTDQMRGHAGQLYDAIAAGRTAPTMTDPANYGQTGVLNLSTGAGPGSSAAGAGSRSAEPVDPTSYLAGYERRNEGAGGWDTVKTRTAQGSIGGPWGAAGGFVGGLIEGAFTRNARTAMTDLTVDQAKEILRNVYQAEGGRAPSEQELDEIIAGQGYRPGDWGVGEAGLLGAIRNLQANFRNERRGAAA